MVATYPAYGYVVTGTDDRGLSVIGPDNNLLELTWPEAETLMVTVLCGYKGEYE
jgi:hypothetical protein